MSDLLDATSWGQTRAAVVTVDDSGQLSWGDELVTVADRETRRSIDGASMLLHHVWNADRTRLRRLVLEVDWPAGPLMLLEARRPRGGWRGDELGRLILAALSCGTMAA